MLIYHSWLLTTAIFEEPYEQDQELEVVVEVRWFSKSPEIALVRKKKYKCHEQGEIFETKIVDNIAAVSDSVNNFLFYEIHRDPWWGYLKSYPQIPLQVQRWR